MRNFNVIKLDSKGRLLVPFHIRELLNLDENSEFIIMNNGNREIKIFPMIDGQTAEMTIHMEDKPGSLARIIDFLGKRKIDLVMSQSKTIEKGKLAEWSAIVDIAECKDFKKTINDISVMAHIKKIDVREK
ncbi:MAG: ACT domain-containing protein [Candidatus Aenigmatarchaeota archaeon]